MSQVKQDVNVKVFSIITKTNQTKAMVKHISFDCKCKYNSKYKYKYKYKACNSNQKWNSKTFQCEC